LNGPIGGVPVLNLPKAALATMLGIFRLYNRVSDDISQALTTRDLDVFGKKSFLINVSLDGINERYIFSLQKSLSKCLSAQKPWFARTSDFDRDCLSAQ